MSANLITGNLFKPIYAYQDADYQAGISGNVTSIMPVGSQMALSIEDANTIKADDGVLITKEGRRIQIDAGAIEEWSIPTGTQGATNYFIIGFHLYTDSNSAEVCETFVEQMESATDTIPEGTFREGATEVYISLGRVIQSGINLDSVTSLVQIAQSFEDVKNAISQLNSDLGSKSSASAVTGNDAFSKIATLNSDLATVESNIEDLEANDIKIAVSLLTYTTAENPYTFPCDGFIVVEGADKTANIFGSSSNYNRTIRFATTGPAVYLNVKKGMHVYCTGSSSTSAVQFIAFK